MQTLFVVVTATCGYPPGLCARSKDKRAAETEDIYVSSGDGASTFCGRDGLPRYKWVQRYRE